ncbi:MAG: alpha/beta hydrolase fold domain-containing protein [Pirellulales bacterium]|nr:alpha/beta hydrolase fold domain-containing protein [Pirellulales bacterium]
MNRLTSAALPTCTPTIDRHAVAPLAPCGLFAPLHYERNYAYPLVVWLHDDDQDEQRLRAVMPHISMRNYVGVAPRATIGVSTPRGNQRRYRWPVAERHLPAVEQRVFAAIEQAEARFHIAAHRVFLAGTGAGGTMALRLALHAPERFAGALSAGGGLPSEGAPLARLLHARRIPLWFACGADGDADYTRQVCDNLRLLHAGGFEVTLRQYPAAHAAVMLRDGLADQPMSRQVLADMDRWIMDLITGARATAPARTANRAAR